MRLFPLLLALSGCATTIRGYLDPGPPVVVRDLTAKAHRVSLPGDATSLRYLNGHSVEVVGSKVLGRLRVKEWRILEGLNGLPVWVGVLERRGMQLGMHDHNSGAYYLLDEDANEALMPHVGQVVMVEGYVDGAHHVAVVYFRILAAPER